MSPPPPKRVLITRAPHQTSALAAHLHALGAKTILIPAIELVPPKSYAPLDAAIAHLSIYDWLLFTSANAVDAFHARSQAARDPLPLERTRVAAIGPATARALSEVGLTSVLIPAQAVAESLAEALIPHITPGHTRILLIRAELARDILPDTLRAAGAELTVAPAYRTVVPEASIPQLRSLFRDPASWPDAITFTSSSTAHNLLSLLEAAGLTLPPDSPGSKTILRASIGPITSQALRDLGLPPHFEAPRPDVTSLAQTLAQHLHLY